MGEKTFTFNIKAIADMKDVTSNIQNIQNALKQLKLPDNLNASFKKNFGELEKELEKYQKLKAGGFKTNSDATALEKSGKNIVRLYSEIVDKINSLDGSQLKKAFEELGGKEVEKLKNDLISLQNQLKQQVSTQNFININETKKGLQSLKKEITGLSGEAEKAWSTLSNSTFNTFAKNLQDGRLDLAANNLEKIHQQVEKINNEDLTKWYDELKKSFDALSNDPGLKNTVQDVEKLKSALNTAKANAIAKLMQDFDGSAKSADELLQKIRELTTADVDFGRAQAQTNKELEQVKSRIQYFFGLNNAINLVKRAIRGAFDTIKELDKAMTETAVVTDFSVGDMWKSLPEYTKRANELGVTTLAAYQAATLYYQQGLKTNEVNALSTETLKMARIAGLDAAEATDRMTNALRGFNMELTTANAQRVDDVYSELAANTASNVDEISTAMTKVASLAHNANMEFETTAAFLAQIIETTRESAETAGTALKTVVARFTEVKKLVSEGELTGTDEEGQAIDVNKVSQALRTAGIDMNKYFLGEVGLDDIFMELASKWKNLTALQQRYIATQAAGSRQQSRFIAMMSDYARTQELVGKAYNANGAAARQFEKTQESLESKLNRLKNAWNEFLMGLTNNIVVKTFVDLLTDLLNGINKFTSAVEASTGSLGKWAASWGVAIAVISGGKALFRDKGLLDGILGMFVGGTKGKGGLLKNILGKRSARIEAFDTFGPPEVGSVGLLGRLGTSLASKGIGKGLANTKFASGLAGMLGFGSAAGGGAAAGGAGAAAAAGLATALGAVAIAAGAAAFAYKAWYELSPEGQLKQATKYAAAMEDVAKKAANAASEIKNVQNQYKDYTAQINEAQTTEDKNQAILERNKYINELLQQDVRYAQYIESVVNEEGQFVLQFKEGELEKVAKAAEAGVARAQVDADFAQAMASGKAANIARNRVENFGVSKNADGSYSQRRDITESFAGQKIGEEVVPLSSDNPIIAQYYALQEEATEKEAEASAIALKAYQELISNLQQMGDIDFDEDLGAVGDVLAKSLAEQYDPEQYFKLVKDQQSKIIYSGEALQEEYFKQFGTWADSSMEDSAIKRAIAIARVDEAQRSVATDKAKQISDFAARNENTKALVQALSGEKVFKDAIEIKDLLSSGNKDLIKELGAMYGWSPDELGQRIVAAQEAANAKRRTASATYYEQLLRAGITPSEEQQRRIYEDENYEQKANIAASVGNLGSLSEYSKFLTDLIDISDKQILDKLEKFTTSLDLTDPIKAFQQLQQAEKEAGNDPALQTLINKVREVNKELLDTPALLRAFSETDEFEDLSKSLSDVVKENGKITPEKLEELAKSSTSLKTILDSAKGSTQGLAEALTMVGAGDISINQVNQALITALNTGKDFRQVLIDIENWIKDFNKGTDFKDGINHFKEGLTELGKLAENWEFGNEITENLYNHLFGPDAYKQLLARYKGNFPALEKAITADVEKYTKWTENYGLEGYRVFQAQSDKATFDKTTGEWDLSQYETTQQAIDDVTKALGVSEGAAKSFIALWTTRSIELKKAWNNLNADEQFNSLIENLGNLESISEETIRTLADKWGIDYQKALERVQEQINQRKLKIPIVPSFTDENGQPKKPEDIVKQVDKALADSSGTKRSELSVFETIHPWGDDEIDEIFRGYDPDKLIEYIQNIGGSYDDAITYLNNSGKELAKVIKVWNQDANGGKGGLVDKIITGSNFDELQTKIQEELQASNYAQQAQAMAKAVSEPIGKAVGEALQKVFEEGYKAKLSPEGNAAAAQSLWDAIAGYLEEHPFTAKVSKPDISGSGGNSGSASSSNDGIAASGGIVKSRANGSSREISPGWALTGEEGPEIVWNKNGGYAYITGNNGPEFQNLQPGDRIFSAPETRRIFRNTSFAKGGLYPSYANPPKGSTIWWKKEETSGKKNKGGGSGGSGSGSKDSEKESNWRNELDWLYNLMEDIVELERDQKEIEEQYEDLLKDQTKTGGDLYRLLVKQLGNLYTQLDHQNFALRKREQEMREFMDKTNDQDKYLWYNWKDRTLEIDWDAIDKIQDEEQYKHIKELVDEAEAIQDKIDDADDSITDITNQIQELENIWRDTFTDFESRVLDAIIKSYQQIIDNYSELNDTLNNSNSQILDSLQKQISLERQIRDNTKTEEEISNEEARLAYLRRDTSGGNDLAALQLEQELADQRQDYEDTLIDQAISRLQEDNDAAAQQRERQIEIMQAQLDYQSENGEFNAYVSDLLTSAMGADGELLTNSDLVTLLKEQENWDAMSAVSKEVWDEELNGTFKEVAAFLLKQNAEENGTFYTALTAAVKSVSSAIGSYSQAMTKMGSQIASAASGGGSSSSGGGSSGGRSGNGKDKGKGGTDFENELVGMTKSVTEADLLNDIRKRRGGGCFAPGTKILMADHSIKNIELVKIGDIVIAYNELTKEFIPKKVTKSYIHHNTPVMVRLTFIDNSILELTPGHPLYSTHGWKSLDIENSLYEHGTIATLLHIGDEIIGVNGNKIVKSIEKLNINTNYDSYNIEVEDCHTFLANGLVAHNMKAIHAYATGGLANSTGLAWLDGTTSEPEYVLNARQTDAFLKLADILPSMMSDTLSTTSNTFGSTYVNLSVNLESVSPDYDVDRMVSLVKDKLYDSSMYRNNNVLSFLR